MVPSRRRPKASLLGPALALAACHHEPGLGPGGLRLSVYPARSVISVGDSTAVVVSLRNLGADSVSLTTGGCGVLPYIAAQPSGQIVYPGGGNWFCIAALRRLTLAPGTEEAETLRVRGWAYVIAPAYPPASLERGHCLIFAPSTASELSVASVSA